MSNITDLKLVELVDKIKKKELSSTEVTIAFIESCLLYTSDAADD